MSNEYETIAAAMNKEENISVYEINGTTYKVRTFFNADCKESLDFLHVLLPLGTQLATRQILYSPFNSVFGPP